eukprot:1158689-Pelagomonas_calceolata.AAC.22
MGVSAWPSGSERSPPPGSVQLRPMLFLDNEAGRPWGKAAAHAYASFRDKAAASRNMAIEAMQEVAQQEGLFFLSAFICPLRPATEAPANEGIDINQDRQAPAACARTQLAFCGRVWSGRRALEVGLVDGLGGVNQAIALVRQAAGIDDKEKIAVMEMGRAQGSPLQLLLGGWCVITADSSLEVFMDPAIFYGQSTRLSPAAVTISGWAHRLAGWAHRLECPGSVSRESNGLQQLLGKHAYQQPQSSTTQHISVRRCAPPSGSLPRFHSSHCYAACPLHAR